MQLAIVCLEINAYVDGSSCWSRLSARGGASVDLTLQSWLARDLGDVDARDAVGVSLEHLWATSA